LNEPPNQGKSHGSPKKNASSGSLLTSADFIESWEASMKNCMVVLLVILVIVFSSTASAQCKDSVVGTWKLVSNTATTEKGDVNKAAFGQTLQGFSPTRRMAE
jgi:hypothetical protein